MKTSTHNIEIARSMLEGVIRRRDEEKVKFLENVETNLNYALQWAGTMAEQEAEAVVAQKVLIDVDNGHSWLDVLTYQSQQLKQSLMRNYLAASSTSHFSNAVENHTRAAYASMYERLESMREEFAKDEEK